MAFEQLEIEKRIRELLELIDYLENLEKEFLGTMEKIHQLNDRPEQRQQYTSEQRFVYLEIPKMQGIENVRTQLIFTRREVEKLKKLLS